MHAMKDVFLLMFGVIYSPKGNLFRCHFEKEPSGNLKSSMDENFLSPLFRLRKRGWSSEATTG
jgi:hypothetical protein